MSQDPASNRLGKAPRYVAARSPRLERAKVVRTTSIGIRFVNVLVGIAVVRCGRVLRDQLEACGRLATLLLGRFGVFALLFGLFQSQRIQL